MERIRKVDMKETKTFNVTADCKPDEHYMVRLDRRLSEIKKLIDDGKYFIVFEADHQRNR